jgi:hypothetical protein
MLAAISELEAAAPAQQTSPTPSEHEPQRSEPEITELGADPESADEGSPALETIPDYVLDDTPPTSASASATGEASEAEPEPSQASGSTPGGNAGGTSDARSSYPHGERDTGQQAAFYIYRDHRSRNYLGVKRTSTKQFPQYHWDGQQWRKGAPKAPKIPYRLPELLAAPATEPVFICEGEKDADNVAALGLIATTNSEGEGQVDHRLEQVVCRQAGRLHPRGQR